MKHPPHACWESAIESDTSTLDQASKSAPAPRLVIKLNPHLCMKEWASCTDVNTATVLAGQALWRWASPVSGSIANWLEQKSARSSSSLRFDTSPTLECEGLSFRWRYGGQRLLRSPRCSLKRPQSHRGKLENRCPTVYARHNRQS